MNYIYDILLNFNSQLYDFFEWELNDNIIHIRKIPLYKVDSKTLLNFKNCLVRLDCSFLEKIKHKTEIFTNKDVEILDYAALFTDGSSVIALNFDSNGYSCGKSYLLVDEDMDVLEVSNRVKEFEITYECISEEYFNPFQTRREQKMLKYIRKELGKCQKQHAKEKLKYLYFDCFGENELSIEKIVNRIQKQIDNENSNLIEKIYDFFKLTSIQK